MKIVLKKVPHAAVQTIFVPTPIRLQNGLYMGTLAVLVDSTGPWHDFSYRPDLACLVTERDKSLLNML